MPEAHPAGQAWCDAKYLPISKSKAVDVKHKQVCFSFFYFNQTQVDQVVAELKVLFLSPLVTQRQTVKGFSANSVRKYLLWQNVGCGMTNSSITSTIGTVLYPSPWIFLTLVKVQLQWKNKQTFKAVKKNTDISSFSHTIQKNNDNIRRGILKI